MPAPTVITIGNFDGVHRGHAALIAEARRIAGPKGRVIALVFHPHPATTLAPDLAPAQLTSYETRVGLLKALGVDEVIQLKPTKELLSIEPAAFIDRVVTDHAPAAFVEGPDFRFGKGRAGDAETLRALGAIRNFTVSIIDPVETHLADQTIVTCSSTITRWLIGHGRVADAAHILGRPYELTGTVVRADQRGRLIGFPTANLQTEQLLPADAVYAGIASLPDGRALPAAIHVGERATFNDTTRTVEAYILDWTGPLKDGWPRASEYDWTLSLRFTAWLRDQARFESVSALVDQINRDVARTREVISETSQSPRVSFPSHRISLTA